MTRQRLPRENAANDHGADSRMSSQACNRRLQVELDAPLLQALLREKRLKAGQLHACNAESAGILRALLLDCLASPAGPEHTAPGQSARRRS